MIINKFEEIEKTTNGYLVTAENAKMLIIFMTDNIIRIRVSFSDEDFDEQSYSLVTTAWKDKNDHLFKNERNNIKALKIDYVEDTEKIIWETESLKLVLHKDPLYISLKNKEGLIVYQDLKERAYEIDHMGRIFHYNKIDAQNDHFYGFGEKTGYLDKKNQRLRMATKDAIGQDPEFGDPMYKHIPFYIKSNSLSKYSLGIFYDNSYDGVFDMGKEISGYWDRYSYFSADGGDINYFLINGPSVKEVIERYTYLVGRSILPTKQSLGYCASTMYYAELEKDCDEEIYRVIDKHLKDNIYIDNFWLASGYSQADDGLRYTFNWNKKKFPNPQDFIEKMNSMGINVMCNLKPGVLKNHPYMDYYKENDAFIKDRYGEKDYIGRWWGGKGRFIDFTSPKARDAWRKLLEDNILSLGSKSVWNDNCELDGIEDRLAICNNEGYYGTMENLKPVHANMMAYTGMQAIKNVYPNERPHIISRAGYAGIQRYAQVWGGDNLTDWRTIKFNINTILGMGLSGCANMGCDIGGFAGSAPDSEMLLRWIQQGIFQPRFTINSANSDNTVTQPFMYKEILEDVKDAYKLRYKLLPYLYSLMYEAYIYGSPVMRPLFYEFPEDENTYTDNNFTFMFGRNILVANVVEKGQKERKIYLPKGSNWYDLNNKLRKYKGGDTIYYPVDLSSIPMFIREDAVLVYSDDIKRIAEDKLEKVTLLISAEKDNQFIFYDDDGHTENYKKGIYQRTQISVKSGLVNEIYFMTEGNYKPTIKQVEMKVLSEDRGAYWVKVDNKKIKQHLIEEDFISSEEGWYYDMSNKIICVKYKRPSSDYSVEISKDKFDLIGMNED